MDFAEFAKRPTPTRPPPTKPQGKTPLNPNGYVVLSVTKTPTSTDRRFLQGGPLTGKDDMLGGQIISVAEADVREADYLIVTTGAFAKMKGWL